MSGATDVAADRAAAAQAWESALGREELHVGATLGTLPDDPAVDLVRMALEHRTGELATEREALEAFQRTGGAFLEQRLHELQQAAAEAVAAARFEEAIALLERLVDVRDGRITARGRGTT